MDEPALYIADNDDVKVSGNYVYCIAEDGAHITGPCKVGVAYDPVKRLGSLQTGNWRQLHIVWAVKFWGRDFAESMESLCLVKYRPSVYGIPSKKRLKSEWIEATPAEVLENLMLVMGRGGIAVERAEK